MRTEAPSLWVSVRAVIEAERAILVIHPSRPDRNRRWHVPGGIRDDVREPLRKTLDRVVQEETGISLRAAPGRVFKIAEWNAAADGEEVRILGVFFHFKLAKRPPVRVGDLSAKHDDLAWINRANHIGYETTPEVAEIVAELLPSSQ